MKNIISIRDSINFKTLAYNIEIIIPPKGSIISICKDDLNQHYKVIEIEYHIDLDRDIQEVGIQVKPHKFK